MEWMLKPLKQYADFNGRARRKEYWMFSLLQIILYLLLAILMGISISMAEPGKMPGPLFIGVAVLFAVLILALIVPTIAVSVRRFHDQDKSGWFYLLSFVPFGGLIVLVFMCIEGTHGPNQYGPDPKQG